MSENYDDITEERLRRELVGFARLILTLERHGALADRSASLLRILGELRRMVFAFEVSCTNRDEPVQSRRPGWQATSSRPLTDDEALDALLRDSMRIVREAEKGDADWRQDLGQEPEEDQDAEP